MSLVGFGLTLIHTFKVWVKSDVTDMGSSMMFSDVPLCSGSDMTCQCNRTFCITRLTCWVAYDFITPLSL
jgi:hypothetical protein